MNREGDIIEIDPWEILDVLLGRIWLILAAGAFFAVLAFMAGEFLITPSYASTTKIYILNKQNQSNVTYSDVQMGTQLTKDYAELISSRYVLEGVIQKLSLDLTYEGLAKKISVNSPTDTRIVEITARDHDPVSAMNIANSVREVAGDHIQNVMDIEAVNVVETANMPMRRASPHVRRWTLAGGLAGMLLVAVISVLQYLLDDTIKSPDDVQKYLELTTLALIPEMEGEGGKRGRGKEPV